MTKYVVIAIGDDEPADADNYVAHVAQQLAEGYTSGHVDSSHYWSIEEEKEK